MASHDDSSESDNETEPARVFQRRISTNKEIRTAVSFIKQTNKGCVKMFWRWVGETGCLRAIGFLNQYNKVKLS